MDNVHLGPAARGAYRHGDLRRALVEVGVDLARRGGPDAVVLREATRRAGVVPNAAYRHFADRQALLAAVCAMAQSAMAVAMEGKLAELRAGGDPVDTAHARVRAIGTAYVRFARAEPGLFRTAFSVPGHLREAANPDRAGTSGLTPFQLLASALDELVAAGVLVPERRPGAEFLAWSAVHGLAMLLIDGPLRNVDDAVADAMAQRVLDMVERGLV